MNLLAKRGIYFKQSGNFKKARKFLKNASRFDSTIVDILKDFGELGVNMLQSETPKDTGKTAASWKYKIEKKKGSYSLLFSNDNLSGGVPVVVLLVYGHVSSYGNWVEGQDFVTPEADAMFDSIQDQIRKEAKRL